LVCESRKGRRKARKYYPYDRDLSIPESYELLSRRLDLLRRGMTHDAS
jgi:hypothetical protein